jgi:hypothetical protein
MGSMNKGFKIMNIKKVISLVVLVFGFVSVGMSYYIDSKLTEGRSEVESAQKKVNTGKALFSITPETERVGTGLFKGAQSQINEGKQTIEHYQKVADLLMNVGITLVILGGLGFVFSSRK